MIVHLKCVKKTFITHNSNERCTFHIDILFERREELDNSKLGSTQQQKICWHWHVARIISSQKMYGLYARKHHIVEMRGDVTDAGRRRQQQLKIELLSQWKLEAESRNITRSTEISQGLLIWQNTFDNWHLTFYIWHDWRYWQH